jgi:uncharacterized protein YecE (DUF72 family)
MDGGRVLVGCAGWSLPLAEQEHFPGDGTHLSRYAGRFPVVEINTSFHRPHRPSTYARWAESVPAGFRFSVKIPKAITHVQRLLDAEDALDTFLAEAGALGDRLGCLLVQLPPSLAFDAEVAAAFFRALRERWPGAAACEPRHPNWFDAEADRLLAEMRVARVAADPAPVPAAAEPGGWDGLVYRRLHGSPRTYYSGYGEDYVAALAPRLAAEATAGAPSWCIFDNTAAGAAATAALALLRRLPPSALPPS